MNELMAQIDFLLVGASFMLILLGLVITLIISSIDLWNKRFFTAFFMFPRKSRSFLRGSASSPVCSSAPFPCEASGLRL